MQKADCQAVWRKHGWEPKAEKQMNTHTFVKVTKDGMFVECVGVLDFSGPTLEFEGNAEASAVEFLTELSYQLHQRFEEEYQRGYKDALNEIKKELK